MLDTSQWPYPLDDEFDFEDEKRWQASGKRSAERAFDLGEAVAGDAKFIAELSDNLFAGPSGYRLEFSRGMASTCDDLQALWLCLVAHLEAAGAEARNCGVLCGVLEVVRDRDLPLAEDMLDGAVQSRALRNFLVELQFSSTMNRQAVERLLDGLDFDDTPPHQFGAIAWHWPLDALDETDLRDLMMKVLARPDGAEIVLSGLSMRLHALESDPNNTIGKELKRVGLLAASRFMHCYTGLGHASIDDCLLTVLKASMDQTDLPEEAAGVFDAFFVAAKATYGCIGDLES